MDTTPSIDFSQEMFDQMQDVAEKVAGQLGVTADGRVIIFDMLLTAQASAATITADDFIYGYVVPATDTALVFEF